MASTVYANLGCPFYDVALQNTDGTAPAAADDDAIFVDMEPTVGSFQTHSVAAQPGVERNVTITVTDANSSVTAVVLELIGTDRFGRGVEETVTDSTAGTRVIVGTKMFATLTTVRTNVTGTVGAGVDKLKAGYGDRLGLPYDIEETTDITSRRKDSTAAVGTLDADNRAWILSGGDVPNGVRTYRVTGRSTVGEAA